MPTAWKPPFAWLKEPPAAWALKWRKDKTMGKRLALLEKEKVYDRSKLYSVADAAATVKKTATAKFDETIEVHVKLGVDPKQSDQNVRGTVVLPNGSGKSKK